MNLIDNDSIIIGGKPTIHSRSIKRNMIADTYIPDTNIFMERR
jgi:hypothetical protein